MLRIEQRLEELGYALPEIAAPVAAYVPAVRYGQLVTTAGQLAFVDGALTHTGKVGDGPGFISPKVAADLARQCALNGLAAANGVLGSLDDIERVVAITAFVASDASFTGQPQVANGASVFLGEVFGEAGIHARSAVGVAVLPLDAPVEVEFTFMVKPGA